MKKIMLVLLAGLVADLIQTGGDGISVAVRIGTEECVENNGFIGVLRMKIALHHGQFIKIRKQSQILSTHCSVLLFIFR